MLVDGKMKKMTCQIASGSTGLITLQIWPTLIFPPNYPKPSNFSLSLILTTTLFFSPPSFRLQIVMELEIVWTVCTSVDFLPPWLQLYAGYSWSIQAKHGADTQRMGSPGLLTNICFLFCRSDTAQRESFAQQTAEDVRHRHLCETTCS